MHVFAVPPSDPTNQLTTSSLTAPTIWLVVSLWSSLHCTVGSNSLKAGDVRRQSMALTHSKAFSECNGWTFTFLTIMHGDFLTNGKCIINEIYYIYVFIRFHMPQMEVVEDLSCRKMPVFFLVFSCSNPSNKEQDLVLLRFEMLFTNVTSVKSSLGLCTRKIYFLSNFGDICHL